MTFGVEDFFSKQYVLKTSNQDKEYKFDCIKIERKKHKKKLQIKWNASHRLGEYIGMQLTKYTKDYLKSIIKRQKNEQ